ncbi:MAG: hypothetical protein AAF495_01630 [Pseudomonadota bacterium]
MFSYWIQCHDYGSEDFGAVSLNGAIEAFESFDWARVLALFDEDDDARNCPPGMGLHDGFGSGNPETRLLHLCPIDEQSLFFNLHYPRKRKWLGFIPTKSQEIHYANPYPRRQVPLLIRQFAEDDLAAIIAGKQS